jgi:hypothetical protein
VPKCDAWHGGTRVRSRKPKPLTETRSLFNKSHDALLTWFQQQLRGHRYMQQSPRCYGRPRTECKSRDSCRGRDGRVSGRERRETTTETAEEGTVAPGGEGDMTKTMRDGDGTTGESAGAQTKTLDHRSRREDQHDRDEEDRLRRDRRDWNRNGERGRSATLGPPSSTPARSRRRLLRRRTKRSRECGRDEHTALVHSSDHVVPDCEKDSFDVCLVPSCSIDIVRALTSSVGITVANILTSVVLQTACRDPVC